MIKSTIASIAMISIAGALSATASADDWDMRAYTGAEIATDSEAANSWTLSATSAQGPGLVFVCTENSGMRGAIVYEPDQDLVDQALFSRGWTANKTGNVTVGDRSMEDRWVHQRRANTLTTSNRSTIVAMLNGVNRGENIAMAFHRMDPMTLTFPETGDAFTSFVQSCPITGRR